MAVRRAQLRKGIDIANQSFLTASGAPVAKPIISERTGTLPAGCDE
jgi:hypothetical protein